MARKSSRRITRIMRSRIESFVPLMSIFEELLPCHRQIVAAHSFYLFREGKDVPSIYHESYAKGRAERWFVRDMVTKGVAQVKQHELRLLGMESQPVILIAIGVLKEILGRIDSSAYL